LRKEVTQKARIQGARLVQVSPLPWWAKGGREENPKLQSGPPSGPMARELYGGKNNLVSQESLQP